MVRRKDDRVRIYTRRGADWTKRFPKIVEAVRKLRVESLLIDGEGIVCGADGLPDFDLLHSKKNDERVSLCAFDLIEFDGEDYRSKPLSNRKAQLKKLLARAIGGLLNDLVDVSSMSPKNNPASKGGASSSRLLGGNEIDNKSPPFDSRR
jgi:bifunctional non-homologous end joining protein LigD